MMRRTLYWVIRILCWCRRILNWLKMDKKYNSWSWNSGKRMINCNCWMRRWLSWGKRNNKKDKNNRVANNNKSKVINWMSLHKWNLKEWTPPWWATNHKPNRTYSTGYKKTNSTKLDSKTSSLRISLHIYIMTINKFILTNNSNLMKEVLLLILWWGLCNINIRRLKNRLITVNIVNNNNSMGMMMRNKYKLLIDWKVLRWMMREMNKKERRD